MAQTVLDSTEQSSVFNNGTSSERKRKKMVALKAIALQLGVSPVEIEEWCDRQDPPFEVAESSRAELEVDFFTMESFVRQWRGYQAQKQAELDIAVLTSAQPVTISTEAARELGVLSQSSELEGTNSQTNGKPEVTLRGVKKGGNHAETLRAVVYAQPQDKQQAALEILRSDGESGTWLRGRILKNIYNSKGATDAGLLRAAQKLELEIPGAATAS